MSATGDALQDSAAEDGGDLPQRIEHVATKLFIRNGYHGVSYLGIAKELGITHSNVHYYYRNKSALAEAVLRRVAADTLASTSGIWKNPETTLVQKFVQMRDWVYAAYLQFNPDATGGRPWGLLSRFSMEADALTPDMKQVIRATLGNLESDVRLGVEMACEARELAAGTPIDEVALQIVSVMYLSGQLTRGAAGFSRLDDLMRATITTIRRAYGTDRHGAVDWPAHVHRQTSEAEIEVDTRHARAPRAQNPRSHQETRP